MAWNRPEDLETPENIDTEQQITNPNIDPECNFELKIHKRKTSSLIPIVWFLNGLLNRKLKTLMPSYKRMMFCLHILLSIFTALTRNFKAKELSPRLAQCFLVLLKNQKN